MMINLFSCAESDLYPIYTVQNSLVQSFLLYMLSGNPLPDSVKIELSINSTKIVIEFTPINHVSKPLLFMKICPNLVASNLKG